MREHNGMRPHDIAVLLKIVSLKNGKWLMKELAEQLKISPSEISESLNRSVVAGLLSKDKRKVNRLALLDFIKHGLQYVFPVKPGGVVKGIPTSHSANPLSQLMYNNEVKYVWQISSGTTKGLQIKPLYEKLPVAALEDSNFYELLSLADAFRIGQARERILAEEEIKKRLYE